jgi:hypothetical protein
MDTTYNFVYKNENKDEFFNSYYVKNSCIYHTFDNTNIHTTSINEKKSIMKKMKDKLSGIRNMIVDKIF